MNITVTSKEESGYLLLKASGSIVNIEEYQLLVKRYLDEIDKYDIRNIIIDETKVRYEKSFLLQSDIINFFSNELPKEVKSWKVACVVDSQIEDVGKFWEYKAQKSGFNFYKVFTSIKEAKKYLNVLGS